MTWTKITRRLAALFALALTTIITMTAAPSAATPNKGSAPLGLSDTKTVAAFYLKSNVGFERCMNVQGGDDVPGRPIILYDCIFAENNLWKLNGPHGDGYFYIISEKSEQCLNVQGGDDANGTPLIQYPCVAAWNNVWYLVDLYNNGYTYLVSADSGRCANVRGGNPANGTQVILYDCIQSSANEWYS